MDMVKEEKKDRTPDEWEIDSWCKTLTEAEEIKADPKKMSLIKPKIAKKVAAFKKISSLDELREKASRVVSREDEMEDED